MVLSTAQISRGLALFVREERQAPRPTVYLDTTIPSYFTAPLSADMTKARMQRITRIWWARYRPNCELFVSDLVLSEAGNGRRDEAHKRVAALESIAAVRFSERPEALVQRLLADGLIPVSSQADAEHLAYAAANSVRFLLTWNCKHLANRMILRRVAQRCEALGFSCPQVCTPETMMRLYAHARRTD